MISPEVVNATLPMVFGLSYLSQSRYRDPMCCSNGCLHLPGCRFEKKGIHDLRRFASSVEELPKNQKIPYIIYKGILGIAACATVVLPVFYVAYLLRKIRLGWERCNCLHNPSCDLGSHSFIPPRGCEEWHYREGGYDSPDGRTWVKGVKVTASSARAMHRRNEHSVRERGCQKKPYRVSEEAPEEATCP